MILQGYVSSNLSLRILPPCTDLPIGADQDLNGEEVSRDTFPLPQLGKQLDKTCEDVYDGPGFSIIRGLDPDAYSVEDLAVIYLGMSSYIGERGASKTNEGLCLVSAETTTLQCFVLSPVAVHVIKRDDETGSQYNLDKVGFPKCCLSGVFRLKPAHSLFTQIRSPIASASLLAAWPPKAARAY